MEIRLAIYVGLGFLFLLILLMIFLMYNHKNFQYELDHKPSESLYGKREVNTNGPFGMEYNNKDSEELNNIEVQVIDSSNILEYERNLERYNELEDDPDKVFMANLCEKMEYDLREKIKKGHCICFKVPLRTRVIRDHEPANQNSDELNLEVNDGIVLFYFILFYFKKMLLLI